MGTTSRLRHGAEVATSGSGLPFTGRAAPGERDCSFPNSSSRVQNQVPELTSSLPAPWSGRGSSRHGQARPGVGSEAPSPRGLRRAGKGCFPEGKPRCCEGHCTGKMKATAVHFIGESTTHDISLQILQRQGMEQRTVLSRRKE